MNNAIVANGWIQLRNLRSGLWKKIEAKHAVELSKAADANEAALIRAKMEADFQKDFENHSPSPYALFGQ
jgi:hypothetical protein